MENCVIGQTSTHRFAFQIKGSPLQVSMIWNQRSLTYLSTLIIRINPLLESETLLAKDSSSTTNSISEPQPQQNKKQRSKRSRSESGQLSKLSTTKLRQWLCVGLDSQHLPPDWAVI